MRYITSLHCLHTRACFLLSSFLIPTRVGFEHLGHTSISLSIGNGAGNWIFWPFSPSFFVVSFMNSYDNASDACDGF